MLSEFVYIRSSKEELVRCGLLNAVDPWCQLITPGPRKHTALPFLAKGRYLDELLVIQRHNLCAEPDELEGLPVQEYSYRSRMIQDLLGIGGQFIDIYLPPPLNDLASPGTHLKGLSRQRSVPLFTLKSSHHADFENDRAAKRRCVNGHGVNMEQGDNDWEEHFCLRHLAGRPLDHLPQLSSFPSSKAIDRNNVNARAPGSVRSCEHSEKELLQAPPDIVEVLSECLSDLGLHSAGISSGALPDSGSAHSGSQRSTHILNNVACGEASSSRTRQAISGAGHVQQSSQPSTTASTLACIFWKHDPVKYQDCAGKLLRNLACFKQHLKRCHLRPEHCCPKCFKVFKNATDKNFHAREEFCRNLSHDPFADKLNEGAAALLKKTPKLKRSDQCGQDPEVVQKIEKVWFDFYRAQFGSGAMKPKNPYAGNITKQDKVTVLFDIARSSPAIRRLLEHQLHHESDTITDDTRLAIEEALQMNLPPTSISPVGMENATNSTCLGVPQGV